MLTGVGIVNNPGVQTLQRLVRHVGGGNRGIRGGDRLSSRMSSVSVDDLRDDLETRSIAASHSSHLSSSRLGAGSSYASSRRQNMMSAMSRESSKESSEESDETGMTGGSGVRLGSGRSGGGGVSGHRHKLVKQQSRQSEMSASSGISSVSDFSTLRHPDLSPLSEDRRSLIRTDLDQDQSGSSCDINISLVSSSSNPNISEIGSVSNLHTSASDSALNTQTLKISSNFVSHLSEVEESCSASDTGSINDLEKKKKKRSFFNFRKKKEKAVS